jgi:iron complex outermembrane receptor protein
VNDPQVSQTALAADIAAGTINPYNIAASDPATLGQVLNYTQYGIGKDLLSNAKVAFDGPLLHLPAGDIRVAIGGEYIHERYQGTTILGTYQTASITPLNQASRNVGSAFAEFNIPVVGPENHIPFIYSLNIAAAERYDHYSDFGGNWAPNIGATLKPVSWIGLRARWNKAFQAPSLVQLASAATPTASVYPGYFTAYDPLLVNPAVAPNGGAIVAVAGTVSPLQPERARDYNLGFDISPPFLEGLDVHFTYFNINYTGQIGTPPLGYGTFWGISSFAPLVQMTPTSTQVQTFLAAAGVPQAAINNALAQITALGGSTYYVADTRARNLGVSKIHGFDISFNYHHAVSFGTVYANFNSSYTASAINAPDAVTFGTNQAGIDSARFNSATVLGATVGDSFRGQLTWNHLAGFNLSAPAALGQTAVGAYNTFDLYTQYDLKQKGLPPITLSLGITNVLNTNPPVYNGNSPSFGAGYANGNTLGRVFELGANVKF